MDTPELELTFPCPLAPGPAPPGPATKYATSTFPSSGEGLAAATAAADVTDDPTEPFMALWVVTSPTAGAVAGGASIPDTVDAVDPMNAFMPSLSSVARVLMPTAGGGARAAAVAAVAPSAVPRMPASSRAASSRVSSAAGCVGPTSRASLDCVNEWREKKSETGREEEGRRHKWKAPEKVAHKHGHLSATLNHDKCSSSA